MEAKVSKGGFSGARAARRRRPGGFGGDSNPCRAKALEGARQGGTMFRRALRRIAGALADPSPAMRAIASRLADRAEDAFETQASPDGKPWAALKPATELRLVARPGRNTRATVEELEHTGVGADPVGKLLGAGRFGISVGWRTRRGLDEVVDVQALAAGVLEDGEAVAAGILAGGGHAQVGDGFHVLSMER